MDIFWKKNKTYNKKARNRTWFNSYKSTLVVSSLLNNKRKIEILIIIYVCVCVFIIFFILKIIIKEIDDDDIDFDG